MGAFLDQVFANLVPLHAHVASGTDQAFVSLVAILLLEVGHLFNASNCGQVGGISVDRLETRIVKLNHVRGPIGLQVHLDAGKLCRRELGVVGQDLKVARAAIFVPVLDHVVVF